MELHRLDGFDASGIDHMEITQAPNNEFNGIVDTPEIAYEILNENGDVVLYADAEENIYVIDGLNGFFRKIGRGIKKFTKNIGRKVIKPVVKTFNRFLNPATILLRNGFLLAMKVDMMKVARKLRFGYLNDAQARKMNIDMGKFRKLQKAVAKAEKIYELAGGRKKNLKKAILRGKGNKDLKVPLSGFGLGNIDDEPIIYNDPFEKFVVESDIATIEAFLNEELEVNGLGAVASGTAMAAASGAVASVAAILSKIGNIFGQAKDVKRQAQTLFQKPRSIPRSLPQPGSRTPIRSNFPIVSTSRPIPAIRQNRITRNNTVIPDPEKKSWIERNKTPLLIGAVGLVAAGGVVIAIKSNTRKSKPISGLPKKRKSNGRDALGRFTKGHNVKKKRNTQKQKASEKLIPKALL